MYKIINRSGVCQEKGNAVAGSSISQPECKSISPSGGYALFADETLWGGQKRKNLVYWQLRLPWFWLMIFLFVYRMAEPVRRGGGSITTLSPNPAWQCLNWNGFKLYWVRFFFLTHACALPSFFFFKLQVFVYPSIYPFFSKTFGE